jgi:hypothetical protein
VTCIRDLLLCVALLAFNVSSASATVRIVDDRGGPIDEYLQAFANVRSTGELVVVDGDCLSACTLVLGLARSNQICATPRARFGFHAPSILNNDGFFVTRAKATQAMWNIYPISVQRWINQHGGLSHEMLYMEGRSLDGIVAPCDRATLHALLVAAAPGYSGTLVPWPRFASPSSARSPVAGPRSTATRRGG